MVIKSVTKNENKNLERISYSIEEASQMLGVSRSFLRLEISRKNLLVKRLGRRVIILKSEIERYLG